MANTLSCARPSSFLRRLNLRAELRLALLAGAEACWIYALVLTLGTMANLPREVSPPGIFVVYMAGLVVGRALPKSRRAWRVLQALTVVCAVAAILVALRIGLYTDVAWWDFGWLGTYFSRVTSIWETVSAEELSTFALVLTFVRALSFAQRPLTLWVVGFQFRLGIVIFFGVATLAALSVRVDFIGWVFVYFGLSLVSISLARIEEAGQERPLGGKWALVMLCVIGVTMLLGFVAAQLLTLDAVNAFFNLLAPLRVVVQILVTLVAIPFFYLFEFLAGLLAPLFEVLRQAVTGLFANLHFNNEATTRVANEVAQRLEIILPYVRYVAVVGLFVLLGLLIARALNRRMKWREDELFDREPLDERETLLLEKQRRPHAARVGTREIRAENVRRIYAALLAHAEALGLARREAETPLEFLPRLTTRFPEAAAAFDTITRAYVAVHYAQETPTDARVRELRGVWQDTKERMKQKGKR